MQANDEEYIAYRPDKYTHVVGDNAKVEDEDEFVYEKALPNFKWNQFMNDYNSLVASDISFKRVKRDEDATDESPAEGNPGSAEGSGAGGGAGGSGNSEDITLYLSPIVGLTMFFGLIFIVGPFLVRKGPNRGIAQCSVMLTAFCMWIFWVTVYIGQMNPLMGPRLENTTLAWMSIKVGNPIAPAEGSDSGGAGSGESE